MCSLESILFYYEQVKTIFASVKNISLFIEKICNEFINKLVKHFYLLLGLVSAYVILYSKSFHV